MVLEQTLESLMDSKEIKPVHPKGNQHWLFIGRTDAEVEAPILWPPDAKSWLTGKNPDAGKHCRQEKETTEDEMVGWHHWLKGHDFEETLGDSKGQGSLACCSLGVSKSQTRLSNWTAVCYCWDFPGGSVVKNLPPVQETQEMQVQPLGGEDPLEEGKAPHSSILAWKIPWTEEPGGRHTVHRIAKNWIRLK